ncbi:hypothetical protein [Streptacidiphilus fuscans]|uniref:Uncharacterized protein n=1 Tax=Streptacidiphilus fuscans TaxID=2789292 RepID=A0A931BBP3_9ACTN|nr:hypothetical protein [Streptacidiphilus fuscans]MBF9073237.1 hypothetical protein [Streptacidiphilus fuscans]
MRSTRRTGAALGLGLAAALALTGCGIRSTAVPVDAGLPASRTACPPTPGASNGPEQPVPSFLVPASASPSAWLALLPGLTATAPPADAASAAAAAASAAQQAAAPSPSPTPSASQSTESLDSCLSLSPSAGSGQAP